MMEIEKNVFVPLEGITQLEDSKVQLKSMKNMKDKTEYLISLDISYKDSFNHECFKVLELTQNVDFNNVALEIKKSDVYVVELTGLDVNYTLGINSNPLLETKSESNSKDNNEVIKEEIKNQYE